jgi:transposase
MRALEPDVVDAVFAAVEPLLPRTRDDHPLGCHRPRVSDRLCFWGLLVRLTTGSSWVDIEALLGHQVSDTTLRARRDEWIDAGVFDRLEAEARAAFDRIIGLDLSDVSVDGSLHKARYRDYAISRSLIHWESQSITRADSPTGLRYRNHERNGRTILLFTRERADDRAFWFLGPARYVSHTGEKPMAITWELDVALPGDLYAAFAAAVA